MKLAAIQMALEPGDAKRNLAHAADLAAAAVHRGAEWLLFPEALPFGWMAPSASSGSEPLPGGTHFLALATLAKTHRVYVCAGLTERSGDKVFNAAVLISPSGDLLLHHRKIHELSIAHGCYALGDRLAVVDTPAGRVGLMICADGFAPGQSISRALSLMGAQVILSPCAWAVPPHHDNAREPYGRLWLDNYGAVTRKFGNCIIGCSNVGPIRSGPWAGHKCIGSSLAVGPGGEPLFQGRYEVEEIILHEIHPRPISRTSAD